TGPVVLDILRNRLKVPEKNILNKDSLEDFGSLPADPNPASREDFLEFIIENKSDIGIVIGPDGSRCLIVGENGFVVSPSDTLAVIADQCKCIPFFQENPLKGIVCSICTSQASDKVAKYSSLLSFEAVPGWAYFAPAMLPALNHSIVFGEECTAVGASSCSYCGDKDAVWTLLAWLSILANAKKSVNEVLMEHWKKFGRNVLGRLDFENLPLASLESFMSFFKETYTIRLKKIKTGDFGNVAYRDQLHFDPSLRIEETHKGDEDLAFDIDNYVFPFGLVRKSLMRNDIFQTYQIQMAKGARVIIRRSESVCNSTTLRFYIEVCMDPEDDRLLADRK
ncbi:Phosphoglucomutase-1, partial [Araneus ventricosus]